MSKVLVILVILLYPYSAGSLHNKPVVKEQNFEYTSATGALDLIEMLSQYYDYNWTTARQHMKTIKLYHGQVWKSPTPEILKLFKGNTLEKLSKSNSLLFIRRNFEMKLALEIGAMKPENCLFNPYDIEGAIEPLVDSIAEIYKAGGAVSRLDIDNSIGHCRATVDDSSFATSRFIMLAEDAINHRLNEMKQLDPDLPIVPIRWAEIEAYPYWSMRQHLRYIYRLNLIMTSRDYVPIEIYFLDVDHNTVNDGALARDFENLLSYCHSLGIKVGVIINGDDENPKNPWNNKDLDYLRSANDKKLVRFKRLGILNKADVVMVQSWTAEANGNRTVPPNVPETGITGTNFFIHTLKCAADISDCEIYPELD